MFEMQDGTSFSHDLVVFSLVIVSLCVCMLEIVIFSSQVVCMSEIVVYILVLIFFASFSCEF
jgi:hypothetical protein